MSIVDKVVFTLDLVTNKRFVLQLCEQIERLRPHFTTKLMLSSEVCNLARTSVNGEVSFFSGAEIDAYANGGILTFFAGFINMESVDKQV